MSKGTAKPKPSSTPSSTPSDTPSETPSEAPTGVLRDLGAATTETKRFGPPERIDGLFPKSKGPYFP